MDQGHAYIWEYRVKSDAIEAFRALYGPTGGWVRLFQRAPGHLSTELHQDSGDPHRFLTIDHWRSEAEVRQCRDQFQSEWRELDLAGEALTDSERFLGSFSFSASRPPASGGAIDP